MKEVNFELAACAEINFENALAYMPILDQNTYFKIALLQLKEALYGPEIIANDKGE